jgi:hypothetical protein
MTTDRHGWLSEAADVAGMGFPVKCKWCRTVHDGAKVTVVGRYSDCSTWRCPGCNILIDDRPLSWGGSAIQLDRDGYER